MPVPVHVSGLIKAIPTVVPVPAFAPGWVDAEAGTALSAPVLALAPGSSALVTTVSLERVDAEADIVPTSLVPVSRGFYAKVEAAPLVLVPAFGPVNSEDTALTAPVFVCGQDDAENAAAPLLPVPVFDRVDAVDVAAPSVPVSGYLLSRTPLPPKLQFLARGGSLLRMLRPF